MLIDDIDYLANKDIRYDPEDKVDLYAYWKESNGTVTWTSAMGRTLDASGLSFSLFVTTLVVAA
jgi:hypothetical protein